MDLGSAFFTYVELSDAAQEGAFYGSIHAIEDTNDNGVYDSGEPLNTSAIEARARGASDRPIPMVDNPDVDVQITTSDPPCAGGTITVDVSYEYRITMPFLGAILGRQTIPLQASMTDTILWPACP